MKTDEDVTELAQISPMNSQLPEPNDKESIENFPVEMTAVKVFDFAPAEVLNFID